MTEGNAKQNEGAGAEDALENGGSEAAEMKERMLRLAAEFDNYKKRTKSEIDGAKSAGKAEMVKELLPVLDEFELALLSAEAGQDKGLVKGIEMVYSNFVDSLRRAGLSELGADGKFDPYKHEIVMVRADAKKKPGTILEVMKKGYEFNGIVLRPASVVISKEPEGTDDAD